MTVFVVKTMIPIVALCVAASSVCADDGNESKRGAVVVQVNSEAIRDGEVQRLARQTVGRTVSDSPADGKLYRLLAEELVTRELARQELAKSKWGETWEAATLECRRRGEAWKKAGRTVESFLKEAGIDRRAWQREVHWQMAWKRYLAHFSTTENLERYFDEHRREFDGTQLRVAQILIKPESPAKEDRQAALQKAQQLKARLDGKQITFAGAARQYSQAPSSKQGGDIGWIERHQPMPEAFSRAAFRLNKGVVGQPVETVFGVHLITVLEEKPGRREFGEVRAEVRSALQAFLLEWLADRRRKTADIKWMKQEDG